MKTKEFCVSDVLTITTGKLLSKRHVEGVYEILNYLSGDNLYTHQLGRGMEAYAPYLKSLFPELDTPELQLEVGRLALMIDTDVGMENPRALIDGWISGIVRDGLVTDGYVFDPAPQYWQAKDPIQELNEMVESLHEKDTTS